MISALIYLFISALRFPQNTSIKVILQRRYGSDTLSCFRRYEKLAYRKSKLEQDIQFIKCCIDNNLAPSFVTFKTSNNHLRNSRGYKNCQKTLLRSELRHKHRDLKSTCGTLQSTKDELRDFTSWIDYTYLSTFIYKHIQNFQRKTKDIHLKKLKKLGLKDRVIPENVIFNFSSRQLSKTENDILSHGLQFALPPTKLDFADHFFSFEQLYSSTFANGSHKNPHFHRQLRHLAHSSFYSFKPCHVHNGLTKDEMQTLKALANDKTIKVLRPDKGSGVVIIDKSDYDTKLLDILGDSTKFEKLATHTNKLRLILKLETKLTRLLGNLKRLQVITRDLYDKLRPIGSYLGRMYGLPKTHKAGLPLRPMLSALKTFNYNAAKYLVKMLNPLTTNEYTVKDSFTFVNELKNLNVDKNMTMASFDVTSLFTNIPLTETSDIISENCFRTDELPFTILPRNNF